MGFRTSLYNVTEDNGTVMVCIGFVINAIAPGQFFNVSIEATDGTAQSGNYIEPCQSYVIRKSEGHILNARLSTGYTPKEVSQCIYSTKCCTREKMH